MKRRNQGDAVNDITSIIKLLRDTKSKGGKVIIYGAGWSGRLIEKSLKTKYDINVDLFCTSFDEEHIDILTGLKVINRRQLSEIGGEIAVIVSITNGYSKKEIKEIEDYILNSGINREHLVTDISNWVLQETKPFFENGNLSVYTISFHVTKQCNLKCRMCGELLFGLVKRRSFPPKQIIRDCDSIFRLINHVEILKLIGGEVMCYPQLDQLISHLDQYHEQIGILELYTNGAVVPQRRLLDTISSYRGRKQITISDYGVLSVAKDDWVKFGGEKNIKVNILGYNKYKGWIDCTSVDDIGETELEIESKYKSCEQRIDYVLEDSVLGPCTSFHMLNYARGEQLDRGECVYLYDNCTDEEKKKKIFELGNDDKPLGVCKYCVWGSDIRYTLPRYPAAEQMEDFPE